LFTGVRSPVLCIDGYGSRSFFFLTGTLLLAAFCFGLTRKTIRAVDT
jgi:hypothetical protein